MVNVKDISDDKIPTDFSKFDRLDRIFGRQTELMVKYHPIEERNGLLITPDCPVNLDCRFGQQRLKDFVGRVNEEFAEAEEALRHNHKDHFLEELSDAFHFMIELYILAGFNAESLMQTSYGQDIEYKGCKLKNAFDLTFTSSDWIKQVNTELALYKILMDDCKFAMGIAMNCLKNKPWKQTHIITDRKVFYLKLSASFAAYIQLIKTIGYEENFLFQIYFKKSEVNKFRQESNY